MVLDQDVISIFRNTLVLGSRPSAFDLLKYPALKRGIIHTTRFDYPSQKYSCLYSWHVWAQLSCAATEKGETTRGWYFPQLPCSAIERGRSAWDCSFPGLSSTQTPSLETSWTLSHTGYQVPNKWEEGFILCRWERIVDLQQQVVMWIQCILGGRREGPSRGQSSLRPIHRRYLHHSLSFTLPSRSLLTIPTVHLNCFSINWRFKTGSGQTSSRP